MIYDFRMYTLKPGKTQEYMDAVRELALPVRKRHGVKLAGWYYSDIGELNQVVHIWAFDDEKHMKIAKENVAKDPEWSGKYIPRVHDLIDSQKTYLMMAADFAPIPS